MMQNELQAQQISATTDKSPVKPPNGTSVTSTTTVEPSLSSTQIRRKRSSLTRSILTLAMGQAGATGIAVLLSPVLTRLYTPEAFGPVTLLTSLVAILSVFGTWSYYRAIPLAKTPATRRGVLSLCLILAAGMTLLVGILTALFGAELATAYGQPELISYFPFLPILFLATSIGQVITISLNCAQKHKTVAAKTMIDKGGTVLSQLALGATLFPNAPLGLIVGSLIGTIMGAMWGIVGVIQSVFGGQRYWIRSSILNAVAYRYRKLPQVYTWSQFIASVGINAPVVILPLFFPLHVVGFYSLAYSILKLPSFLFTNASGQIYYVEAANLIAKGESPATISTELLKLLSRLTAFPVMLLFLMAPSIFEIVFGSNWREAGVYAQVLAPWVLVTVIGTPFMSLLSAYERFNETLAYTSTLLVVRIGAIVIGGLFCSATTTLLLYSIANTVVWAVILARVFRLAGMRLRSAIGIVTYNYLAASLFIIPGCLVSWMGRHEIAGTVLAIAAIFGYISLQIRAVRGRYK